MPSLKSYMAQDGVEDDPEPRKRGEGKKRDRKAGGENARNRDVRERTTKRTKRARRPNIKAILAEKMAERALVPSNDKLAVEEMDKEIAKFERLMEVLYPWDEKGEHIKEKSLSSYYWASEMRRDYLALRAPYQTPRLSAIAIQPVGQQTRRITEVNVTILNDRGEKEYTDAPEEALDSKLIEGEILASPEDEEAA